MPGTQLTAGYRLNAANCFDLAKEFAAETTDYEFHRYNAFDPKKLLFWVCTSEAYGLSSVANATNDKPEAEVFYSRMLLKAMSPLDDTAGGSLIPLPASGELVEMLRAALVFEQLGARTLNPFAARH